MKRTLTVTLLIAALVVFTGCSKDKEKENLRSEVTALQEQVTQLESQNKDLKAQLDQATLKTADEKRQAEDLTKALETRLIHQEMTDFEISPAVPNESGWLIVDGEHTYTLTGHTAATKVTFYWADGNESYKPNLLGEDTNGKDGWSWKGTLPFGNMRAFWAEVQYPGGLTVNSAVLPLRSGGK